MAQTKVKKEEGHYTIKRVVRLPKKGNANWLYAIIDDKIEELYRWDTFKSIYETLPLGKTSNTNGGSETITSLIDNGGSFTYLSENGTSTTITLLSNVIDNLTSSSTDNSLSANQGKILKDAQVLKADNPVTQTPGFVPVVSPTGNSVIYQAAAPILDVEDGLSSVSADSALSANQGKILKDEQDRQSAVIGQGIGNLNMGTYTGSTISDNGSAKENIQELESSLELIPDEVIENSGALTGSVPLGAQVGINITDGSFYYNNGGNWTPIPVASIDLNTTVSNESGSNGTGVIVPANAVGTPEIGDLHIEIYDDVTLYFTSIATNWTNPVTIEVARDLINFSDAILASTDGSGSGGVSSTASRSDHKHIAQGVSSNTNQLLSVGSDGLHHLEMSDIIDATESSKGISELATNAETITGTDSRRTITPAALKSKLDDITSDSEPVETNSTTGAVGTSENLSREDHKHPSQKVSNDANNIIINGSDGLSTLPLDPIGFDGNLETTDDTLQKIAQKFDDYNPAVGAVGIDDVLADNQALTVNREIDLAVHDLTFNGTSPTLIKSTGFNTAMSWENTPNGVEHTTGVNVIINLNVARSFIIGAPPSSTGDILINSPILSENNEFNFSKIRISLFNTGGSARNFVFDSTYKIKGGLLDYGTITLEATERRVLELERIVARWVVSVDSGDRNNKIRQSGNTITDGLILENIPGENDPQGNTNIYNSPNGNTRIEAGQDGEQNVFINFGQNIDSQSETEPPEELNRKGSVLIGRTNRTDLGRLVVDQKTTNASNSGITVINKNSQSLRLFVDDNNVRTIYASTDGTSPLKLNEGGPVYTGNTGNNLSDYQYQRNLSKVLDDNGDIDFSLDWIDDVNIGNFTLVVGSTASNYETSIRYNHNTSVNYTMRIEAFTVQGNTLQTVTETVDGGTYGDHIHYAADIMRETNSVITISPVLTSTANRYLRIKFFLTRQVGVNTLDNSALYAGEIVMLTTLSASTADVIEIHSRRL
jgi:hypothetical protein